MRMTRLLSKTMRQDPTEGETVSHKYMLKAAMIAQVAAGVYTYLPLALRSLHKIENIIRQEIDAAGGQEIRMPALQPLELWEQSGRAEAFGPTLFRFKDRRDRPLVLAPTHEEAITHLVRANVRSYRDLPILLYQIQTKFRDETRSRGGLIRVREFDMKDAYSFDVDERGLELSYRNMMDAYKRIYARCGLSTIAVEADSGAIGGKESHEFILPAESGEDVVLICDQCGYSANAERACFAIQSPEEGHQEPLDLHEVYTPATKTIAALSEYLELPPSKTLKAVFYTADGQVVLATIRGDFEVNEVKLKNLLRCNELRLTTAAELQAEGLVAGFASPIGLGNVRHVADESINQGTNFAAGANKLNTHFRNANYPRDFQVDLLGDIALAQPGHSCPKCGKTLRATRGIEVGHIFKLGTFFSDVVGAHYLDRQGTTQPITMGCYGIGIGRLLAATIEQNHDDKGIVFPVPIAPYQVHILALNTENSEVLSAAEKLYQMLIDSGYEVLYDDRAETAGVKFNDADLIGLPVRLVISPRTLKQDAVELKLRRDSQSQMAHYTETEAQILELLKIS